MKCRSRYEGRSIEREMFERINNSLSGLIYRAGKNLGSAEKRLTDRSGSSRNLHSSELFNLVDHYLSFTYGTTAALFRFPTIRRRFQQDFSFGESRKVNENIADMAGVFSGLTVAAALTTYCRMQESRGNFTPAYAFSSLIVVGNIFSCIFELGYRAGQNS